MNKAALKLKHKQGPGALTLAWGGLALALVAGALIVQVIDWPVDDGSRTIALGEPERFARPSGEAPATGSAAPVIIAEQEAAQAGNDALPSVRAARPGEFESTETATEKATGATETTPATQEEALASAGDNAAIIRVEDLPRPGEERPVETTEPQAPPLRIAGTAPPRPDPALWRETGNGPMPQIAQDGRRPARFYARTFAATEGAPRLGLIVSGLGLSRGLTDRAIETLPAEATLAFAPYARNLDTISRTANADGHELMIELPMEATGVPAEQLGPAGLRTDYDSADNLRRLDWMLTRTTGYFGVTNYLGTSFSSNAGAMRPVIERIRSAGLAYVTDAPLADGITLDGMAGGHTDYLVSGSDSDLLEQLSTAEQAARATGSSLVKVYVTEDNLDTVAAWANGLKAKGIALAPASAILNQ